jgi:hypothetical protein
MTPTLAPPALPRLATTLAGDEALPEAAAAVVSPAPMAGQAPPAAAAEEVLLEPPELLFPHAVRAKARPELTAIRARVVLRIRVPFILVCVVPSRAGTENVVGDNIRMLWATTYATQARD